MSRKWNRSAVIPKNVKAIYLGLDVALVGKTCRVVTNTAATSDQVLVEFDNPDKICYVKVMDLDFSSTQPVRKQHAEQASEVLRRCGTEYPQCLQ